MTTLVLLDDSGRKPEETCRAEVGARYDLILMPRVCIVRIRCRSLRGVRTLSLYTSSPCRLRADGHDLGLWYVEPAAEVAR